MMDREERSVVCTYSANLSSQNSALGVATAFSKGLQSTYDEKYEVGISFIYKFC